MFQAESGNLSDSSTSASHVSGRSNAQNDDRHLIEHDLDLSYTSVSSVRADQKDEEIRLLKAENIQLKRRIGEIDSDSSDSDGGGGDVRKMWNELGSDRKRRILAKICRDMYKVAEKRGTEVEIIAANIIARYKYR